MANTRAVDTETVATACLTVQTGRAIDLTTVITPETREAVADTSDDLALAVKRTEIRTLSDVARSSNPSGSAAAHSIDTVSVDAVPAKTKLAGSAGIAGEALARPMRDITLAMCRAVEGTAVEGAVIARHFRGTVAGLRIQVPVSLASCVDIASSASPVSFADTHVLHALSAATPMQARGLGTCFTTPAFITVTMTGVSIALSVDTSAITENLAAVRASVWVHTHALVVFGTDTPLVAVVRASSLLGGNERD